MSVEIKNKFVKKAYEIVRWTEKYNKELAQKFDELDQIRFEYRTTYEIVRKRLGNQSTFDQRYSAMKRILCEESKVKVAADVLRDFSGLIEEVISGNTNSDNETDSENTSSVCTMSSESPEVEYDHSRLRELLEVDRKTSTKRGVKNPNFFPTKEWSEPPISLSSSFESDTKDELTQLSGVNSRFATPTKTENLSAGGVSQSVTIKSQNEKKRLLSTENEKDLGTDMLAINDKNDVDVDKVKAIQKSSQPHVRLSIECLNTFERKSPKNQMKSNGSISEQIIESFKKFKE